MGAWLQKHGEVIYGTRGGPYRNGSWGGSCHKGHKLYLHVSEWPVEGLVLSFSEDGQQWEEIWRAKAWEHTWLVPVAHVESGIRAPGRQARCIRVETQNEAPRERRLRRLTVFGGK